MLLKKRLVGAAVSTTGLAERRGKLSRKRSACGVRPGARGLPSKGKQICMLFSSTVTVGTLLFTSCSCACQEPHSDVSQVSVRKAAESHSQSAISRALGEADTTSPSASRSFSSAVHNDMFCAGLEPVTQFAVNCCPPAAALHNLQLCPRQAWGRGPGPSDPCSSSCSWSSTGRSWHVRAQRRWHQKAHRAIQRMVVSQARTEAESVESSKPLLPNTPKFK